MAGTDAEQNTHDSSEEAANDLGADPANAPTNVGPNLPRQVERNVEDSDGKSRTPPRRSGRSAAQVKMISPPAASS